MKDALLEVKVETNNAFTKTDAQSIRGGGVLPLQRLQRGVV